MNVERALTCLAGAPPAPIPGQTEEAPRGRTNLQTKPMMNVERALQAGPATSLALRERIAQNRPRRREFVAAAAAESTLRTLSSFAFPGTKRLNRIRFLESSLQELGRACHALEPAPSAVVRMSEIAADTLFFAGVLLGRGGPGTSHVPTASDDEYEVVRSLQFNSLMLLHQAIITLDFIAARIANQRPCVITEVFAAMADPHCFDPGAALAEELLSERKGGFELADVAGLDAIIERCNPRQLAALCHTIASTVMDASSNGAESSTIIPTSNLLKERRERSRVGAAATLDRNHAVLVASPMFLHRIVKLISLRPIAAKDSFLLDVAQVEGVATMDGTGEAFVIAELRNDAAEILSPEDEEALRQRMMAAARRITSDPRRGGARFESWNALEDTVAAGSASEVQDRPIFVRDILMAAHQVEVLFILFSLLGGHRRADVHRKMLESGVVTALHRLSKQLDWEGQHGCLKLSPHGDNCDCNTESALKMHFLRVCHFLCDRMDDGDVMRKRFLLSASEREILEEADKGNRTRLEMVRRPAMKKRTRKTEVPFAWADNKEPVNKDGGKDEGPEATSTHENLSGILRHLSIATTGPADVSYEVSASDGKDGAGGCDDDDDCDDGPESPRSITPAVLDTSGDPIYTVVEKGLFSELIVIMQTAGEPLTRSCTASAIEAFLRGGRATDQEFAARSGLLGVLLHGIADGRTGDGSMLQSYFDLLGELIKLNRNVFALMNEMFMEDEVLLNEVLTVTTRNLVDSNVFIRSLLVSLEHFRAADAVARAAGNTKHVKYCVEKCPMTTFLSRNGTLLLYNMCRVVRHGDIDHENICCLNTSVVFFVFARSHGHMDMLCQELEKMDGERKSENNVSMVENLCKLLNFWKEYYAHRGVDALSLAVNSGIEFAQWRKVVDEVQERMAG